MERVIRRKVAAVDLVYSTEGRMEGAREFAEKRHPAWEAW
jgi:1,4-dihydroxy-2-naphthoyl-CoA synthase